MQLKKRWRWSYRILWSLSWAPFDHIKYDEIEMGGSEPILIIRPTYTKFYSIFLLGWERERKKNTTWMKTKERDESQGRKPSFVSSFGSVFFLRTTRWLGFLLCTRQLIDSRQSFLLSSIRRRKEKRKFDEIGFVHSSLPLSGYPLSNPLCQYPSCRYWDGSNKFPFHTRVADTSFTDLIPERLEMSFWQQTTPGLLLHTVPVGPFN